MTKNGDERRVMYTSSPLPRHLHLVTHTSSPFFLPHLSLELDVCLARDSFPFLDLCVERPRKFGTRQWCGRGAVGFEALRGIGLTEHARNFAVEPRYDRTGHARRR